METKKGFKVQQCSAVKVVTRSLITLLCRCSVFATSSPLSLKWGVDTTKHNRVKNWLVLAVISLTVFLPVHAQAGPLDTWTQRVSGTVGRLEGIAYANNIFVAVGGEGTILTSSDGLTWTQRSSNTTSWLQGITYGKNIFATTGTGGTILTSSDGLTWTLKTSGVSVWLEEVAYGGNTFVAVGDGGGITASTDGISWTPKASGTGTEFNGVTYGKDIFVAVANSGLILTSPDGTIWTSRVSGVANSLGAVIFADNKFVVVGDGGAIITSDDGLTWTKRSSGISEQLNLTRIAYGGGTFVAVGDSGTIITSTDGISWTPETSGQPNVLKGVAYGDNTFVAVGYSGTIVQSDSLITVTKFTLTVSKSGTGPGTVTSNPTGINCGSTCSASFNSGTSVTLTAAASSGSTFAGWSGSGCSGTGSCSVTMDASKDVTAVFDKPSESYSISLTSDWNLISLPLSPSNTAIGTVLSNISGKYSIVWAYTDSQWKGYDPSDTEGSDLKTMEAGKGYWIKMTSSDTLAITGTPPSTSLTLTEGWNLVGYNNTTSASSSSVLDSISSKYCVLWSYMNNRWKGYDPSDTEGSDLAEFTRGYGYWIKTTEAVDWEQLWTPVEQQAVNNMIANTSTATQSAFNQLSLALNSTELSNFATAATAVLGKTYAVDDGTGKQVAVTAGTALSTAGGGAITVADVNAAMKAITSAAGTYVGPGGQAISPLAITLTQDQFDFYLYLKGLKAAKPASYTAFVATLNSLVSRNSQDGINAIQSLIRKVETDIGAGKTGAASAVAAVLIVTATSMPLTSKIGVLPASKDFGFVLPGTASTPQAFTVSNTGTGSLNIGTINITSTNASEFILQNDNCTGKTIIPSGNCTLGVTFSPSTTGSKTATLSIPSNDPDTLNLNISLSGTGENTTIRTYKIGDSVNYNLKATHIASGGQATGSITYRIIQDETNPYGIVCEVFEDTGTITGTGSSTPIYGKDLFYQDADGSLYDCGKYNSSTGSYVFIQNDQSTPNGLRLAIKSPLSVGDIQQATTSFEDGSWKTCTNKVEARENVTTPSGTFMAYKISSSCSSSDGTSQEGIEWFYPSIFYVKRITTSGGFEIRYDMTGYNMP